MLLPASHMDAVTCGTRPAAICVERKHGLLLQLQLQLQLLRLLFAAAVPEWLLLVRLLLLLQAEGLLLQGGLLALYQHLQWQQPAQHARSVYGTLTACMGSADVFLGRS